jgi:hypothetical protein
MVTSGGGINGSGSAGLNRLADGRQRFARGIDEGEVLNGKGQRPAKIRE